MTGTTIATELLLDEAARHRIVHSHDENLFVDAGAGSGKTKQLVDRVVAMVATGHLPSISGLAAITFTENAATELRRRIREALEEHADTEPDDGSGPCTRALAGLDDAAITTLHGFAARLLLDFPLEAGLPPGFAVRDAIASSIDRDGWWRARLDDWYAAPALAEVWRIGLTLDLRVANLREVAAAFDANWDMLVDRPIAFTPLPALDVDSVVRPLRRLLDYAGGRGPVGDLLTAKIDGVIAPLVEEADAESDPLQALAILEGANLKSAGQAGPWQAAGLDKKSAVDLLTEAAQARDALIAACKTAVTTTLTELLRCAVLAHATERRLRGELWFHDLLVHAVGVLATDTAVRAAMHARWSVLCVDEFQDTDPLQVRLVHLIAGHGTWPDTTVDPGRLFFVGDPKQSIYRFRRAEVALFAEVRAVYSAGLLELVENFRSRPGILDAVNAVFEPLLAGGPIPYQALHAAHPGVADDPGPDVLLLGEPRAASMGAIREAEAEHVAATLARARGSWLVRLPTPAGRTNTDQAPATRPAAYGDMAILVPTRTSLAQLEEALDRRGIPYRIMSRSLIWETDAVRDLVTVLQSIEDAADAVALVAALRHPMFACGDDDLVAWRAAGGAWRYDAPVPAGTEGTPVADAMTALRRYHDLRWWLPVNGLLDRILRERRAVELTAVHRRPRDHWRRLRFLLDQSRAFLDGGGTGLTGFVRWAREQIASAADAIETVTPERDDDAVQILTIHASKGLEFPIVALTGINSPPRPPGRVIWSPAGPEIKLDKGFRTAGYAAVEPEDVRLDAAENLRLLYVGMTRAAEHLVVSLQHKAGKGEDHARRLYKLLPKLGSAGAVHEPVLQDVEAVVPPRPDAAVEPVAADGVLDERGAFLAARAALLADVHRRLPITATGLVAAADQTAVDAEAELEDPLAVAAEPPTDGDAPGLPTPRAVGPGGAALGSAVHLALEIVDFSAGDGATAEAVGLAAASACAECGVPALQNAVTERVRAALASPILRAAADSPHWKEVPIAATLDGRIVEGVIDLVVQQDGGLVVVDYKTDAARTAADVDAKVAHYTPQLRAYARALTAATGMPVVRALLLFCRPDRADAVDVPL